MATTKKTTKKEVKAEAMELPIYSATGEKGKTIALPAEIFGAPWRADLVHQVVTGIQANMRLNRAHTKDRSEVAGGGKKPWKQKGTGQARHGSSRSPIWRHGGITFGPRSTRDYSEKLNKKMRVQALMSVLAQKVKDGEVILVEGFGLSAPKTSAVKNIITALAKGAEAKYLDTKKKNAALIAFASYDTNAVKSFRNMGNMKTEEVRNLNPLDVLTHKYLIIENPMASFKVLADRAKK